MRERYLARGKRFPAQCTPQSAGRHLRMTGPSEAHRGSGVPIGALPGAGTEGPGGHEDQERIGELRLQRTSVGKKALKSTRDGEVTRLYAGANRRRANGRKAGARERVPIDGGGNLCRKNPRNALAHWASRSMRDGRQGGTQTSQVAGRVALPMPTHGHQRVRGKETPGELPAARR